MLNEKGSTKLPCAYADRYCPTSARSGGLDDRSRFKERKPDLATRAAAHHPIRKSPVNAAKLSWINDSATAPPYAELDQCRPRTVG
jgi:hypothetical protein